MTDAIATQRLAHLEALHAEHLRFGRQRQAIWIRGLARKYCAEQASPIVPPEWCALKPRKTEPASLGATLAEHHAQPLELPRYDSLRAWAKAALGASSRVVCWHPQPDGAMRVSLVIIATDLDRTRSPTFASEADALEAIAIGAVKWQAPKKAAPKTSSRGTRFSSPSQPARALPPP